VPEEAKLTTREALLLEDSKIPDYGNKKRKARQDFEAGSTTLGLSLELSVHNHRIIAREKACSVSHVVWEQRKPDDPRFPLATTSKPPKKEVPNNKKNPDHRGSPPIIETGNMAGGENVKPLREYVQGVEQ
jgi:hypothetical protein